jgi:hypothetical protein
MSPRSVKAMGFAALYPSYERFPTIERASSRIMIDSCFVNLTDQLGIPGHKVFLVRSPAQFTPVLLGDWVYLAQS